MSIISDTTVELVPVPFAAPSSSSFECGFDHELDFESLRLIISQNHDDSEKNCQLGMDVSWFDDGGSGVGSEGSGVGDGDTTRSTTSGDTTRSTTTNDTNISIHHNFQLEESNLNSFLTSRNEAQYYHYYYLQNLQNHTNQLTELSNRLKYQLENELKFIPNPNYQHQIQPNSSGINRHQHVNSIIHLCNCLGYELETAWTAVNFFDRYLSKIKLTQKRQFASLIPCCVFVAAKMSEEQPFEPVIADFVSRCDCLTASSMKRMEKKLINVLEWDLNVITPQAVLHQIIADLFPNITNSQQARIIRIADGYFCSYLNDSRYIGCKSSRMACAVLLMIFNNMDQDHHHHHLINNNNNNTYFNADSLVQFIDQNTTQFPSLFISKSDLVKFVNKISYY